MIIVLEGNIGAGKSSFIDAAVTYFKKCEAVRTRFMQVVGIKESVDRWVESGLLDRFYTSPLHSGFFFQNTALCDVYLNELRALEHHKRGSLVLLERSTLSSTSIFYPLMRNKLIDSHQAAMDTITSLYRSPFYEEVNGWIHPATAGMVDPYRVVKLYLRATPDVCMTRIKKRNRQAETSVSLDYVTAVHLRHEQLLLEKQYKGRMLVLAADNMSHTDPLNDTCFFTITNGKRTRKDSSLPTLGEYIADLI
jgi:thymidylate kinase